MAPKLASIASKICEIPQIQNWKEIDRYHGSYLRFSILVQEPSRNITIGKSDEVDWPLRWAWQSKRGVTTRGLTCTFEQFACGVWTKNARNWCKFISINIELSEKSPKIWDRKGSNVIGVDYFKKFIVQIIQRANSSGTLPRNVKGSSSFCKVSKIKSESPTTRN